MDKDIGSVIILDVLAKLIDKTLYGSNSVYNVVSLFECKLQLLNLNYQWTFFLLACIYYTQTRKIAKDIDKMKSAQKSAHPFPFDTADSVKNFFLYKK